MCLRILVGAILMVACTAWSARGLELVPFASRNLYPQNLVHGLAVAEPARLNPPGELSARLGFDLANYASLSRRHNEQVHFDGESYMATLGLRYGFGKRLQVGFDLPWIRHDGGAFDSFIEDWHKAFGLPNGDRDKLPDNDLSVVYTRNGEELVALDEATDGLGDLRLLLAWQWLASEPLAASLQSSVKLPTGDAQDLTGSGGWDIALALSLQRDFQTAHGNASVWGGVSGTWLGEGDLLEDQVKDWAVSGWLGAGWSPLDWLGLKLQLDSHSALYESGLDELGDAALLLTLGGTLGLGETTTLDIGVGEDLAVSASPDVSLHLLLNHRF